MAQSDSESRRLILALHERGWSDQRIAKSVGRNSSLIKQIRDGKKPGNNLTEALRAARAGGPIPAPPRRTQRLRTGRVKTPSGRFVNIYYPGEELAFLRKLRTLARRDKNVQLIVTFLVVFSYGRKRKRDLEDVPLYGKGGREAAKIVAELEKIMRKNRVGAWEAVAELVRSRPGVDDVDGFVKITVYEL